jgi:hypothetical protein
MATKQLDFIATTSPADRKRVMPRIHCKDGLSLSIQASAEHFSWPFSSNGPWTDLEVAFLSDWVATPNDWKPVSHGEQGFGLHDHTGIDTKRIMNPPDVYVVPVEKLREFIESHGGEADEPMDEIEALQAQVNALREAEDRKWAELESAQAKERAIWDVQIAEVFGLVPDTIDQAEANRIVLEKYMDGYDTALKEVNRLFDEWSALVRRANELSNQCCAKIEARNASIL